MFKFEDNDNKVFCIKDSNVELSATFETLPKDLDTITIEWTRDGKPITNSEKFKVTKTKNAIQLAIQHVQRDDAGHYTLYAKTDTGETAQKDIELLVEDRSFGDNPPVFLRRLNDLAVKVGTRTRLLVEIRSATDVRVTWYRNDRRICENDRINFVNEGSFYCLEISSITLDDGGKWMCMAENLGGRNSCLATLNVLVPKAYKAPEFVEELRAILTEQGTVSLECKVVGVPTPILRWFKDSKEIKAGDVFALTANPDDLTSLGTYTCEAINCMGKTYSSSKLHISGKTSREGSLQPPSKLHGPPPIFTSELKDINSKIGDTITLGCQVMVPPWPKSVTWYNKEGKVESSEKYKLIEDGLGSYILEIKPAEYSDEGEWKFVVASNEGTVSISTCSVHMDIPKNYRKPRFMENLKAILTEEGLVSFECKVVGFPTPLLRWFKDGHELKPGDVYQLTGTNSLGSYSCIARNCMGEACSSAVLTLEDIQNQLNENERIELQQKNQPPKFIKGLMSCETKINEEFKFTVQIKATTEPVFSWFRDDLPIDKTNERFEISTEKVGFCHLTIKYVEFVDQAEWKCVATNEFGHSTSTCFLKLQIPRHYKKPRFLECLRAVLTEEGAVNLECKVIGVPQPTLRWFKDGVELKPGDIHRIISGKDGECSLGTYTCEARNCMGVVTSSATLLGYEENYKSIPKPEPANILQRHLSLSTIHEERTSQLYDTPMGDITVDEKGDVSFSFDGKEVSVSLYETPDLTEEEALQIVEMYADQISEHVTEQNIVELPPLRFVKETTQSGNLLMEAVVIDVSPDYFPPEEDMRTEADMEDISVVDPMSQAFEDPLSEQSLSKRRRKEESLKSGEVEEFFSLSQSKQTKPLSVLENYVVEEAHSDEEITETDLQTFESAKSSEKGDSDKQKKVIKSDDSLQEQPPKLPPRKRPAAADSKDEDSVYLQDISGEQGDGLKTQTKKKIDVKTITINKSIIEKVIKTVIIVEQHLIAVENEVIAQSSLMMSPTSGDSSIGIVKSVLEPINAIECKVNEYNGERNVDNLVENLMPDLKSLNHGLSIIEKCVEMDSEGKTLVQRTSVCVIESVGIQMLAFLESLKQVCLHNVQGSLQNESLLIINDMQTGIHITEDTIKSQTLIQEATALEASQRVSETVAQMQQSMPETVPLEVVTTAELPKEANSFKLLCRYILKFQEILETSQQSDVKKETLAEIQKPIIAIQNEIHLIEEKISKNSLKDTIEEKISFKILDTVSPPLYELNKCFEAITKNIESGNKSPKILDPFILPLQEIQTGLALIGHEIDSGFIKKESPIDTEDNQKLIKNVSQNVIYVESNIENIRDSTSMTVYDSLIQLKVTISTLVNKIIREPLTKGNLQIIWALKIPLEELNYCFRHIEERSTSGSLRDLLDPLNSLKENMEVVEEKLRQMRISSNVEEINKIKNLVDQCDAEIQLFDIIQLDNQERMNQQKMLEQQLSEHSQNLSEMHQQSIWTQEKCDVLTNVQQNIVNIQEIILFEKDKSFSEPLSTLKTLANPLRELSRQIANIREEILLENVNDISINDYKAILKLANPIREICQQLAVITKASTFESAQVFSSKSDQNSLKSIAVPLAELRNCIAAIQHECITLHEIQGEISHPQISLKTARPLEELRLRVEEIIHNIVEPDEISTTLDDVSVMKTMSEMSDEVKVESSKHVVKVTETKVETAYMEEKVIEIKQLDVEASDIDEKKSLESQQHADIKTDVETAENIEKVAEQKSEKVDETLKVTEEESSKIIETSKQDIFEPQEQKFSQEIQSHLLKMKEEMETVMIAVQNMSRPTPEVQAIEKELKTVLDHVSNLPNNVNEMNKIIKIIDSAEKSISSRKTSDVILVKYNLESLKKTLKIIIKTIYPEHVDKKEEVQENKEIVTEKIVTTEKMEVQIVEDITKIESQQGNLEPKVDINASVSQAENQVKKVKILIKKISTIPEMEAAEQELAIAFENLTDITTNPEKFDKAIEIINVVESKLMAEKSSDLVEILENFTTLKQILIILKSSISTQQVKVEENKEQVHATELQVVEVPDSLKIVESVDAKIERIDESAIKPILTEQVELTDKIKEIKLLETDESKSLDNLESKSSEIVKSKPLEIVETKSEELKITEEKTSEITQTEAAVLDIIQPVLKDKVQESITESTSKDIKEKQIEELKITEVQTKEAKVSQDEATILEENVKEVVEIKESTTENQTLLEIKEPSEAKIQEASQQILPEIQECLTKTKENVETATISIKKARRPTDELKAVEKELTIILENISELAQNKQQIEKVIEKIEAAEVSLSARKTSDIVIVKENLTSVKQSLVSLNNAVIAQKVEIKDIEAKSQSAEIEIIESKEELKIVEDIKSVVTEEIKSEAVKSDEKQAEIEKSTSIPVESTAEKIDQTLLEIKEPSEAKIQEASQQILLEIQECLTKTKENVETATISIKKARRPTDELKAVEKELTIILENISELAQNKQQIEKVIEKIEAAEASLSARKTSDIVIVKDNLILLKTSLISLNNAVNTQKVEIKDIEAKSQSAEIEIIESKEELKIVEDIKSVVTEEIKSEAVKSDEKQAEIEKSTSIPVESTAEKIDQTLLEIKDIEAKLQSAEIEIFESKEELKIVEDIKSIVTEEIKTEVVKSDEKQVEIEESASIPVDLKEVNDEKCSEIQAESPHTEVKLQPEVEQCLLKTKDEIETVTMSIKKVRRTTSELESVQGQLNVALENIKELPENVQQVEKIIESIEKAEASLLARKTSDIIVVKESLSNLKQSLVILTNTVKSHKAEVSELKPETHIADLQIIETSEELKIVESNECIAEKVEETVPEKIEENVPEKADTKLPDSIQNKQEQMAEILPVEQIEKECEKSIESIQIVEQNASESIEVEKCLEKSKAEIAHTIESIHKVRRTTPEIQAIERQLSTTFENVMEIQNNDKIIEEILNKIEAVEESIAIRRTSDISDLKGNLMNLKQSLVTLKTVIVQHNSQIQTVGAQPQQAVISVIETIEELQITEPCGEEKKELTKVDEKPIIDVEHAEEKLKDIKEITEQKVEKVSEISNEITVYLTNTKTEIENVTASVKKVRHPTTELQAAQEELNTALEKLENLPENPEQIEKVIETIEKAAVSLVSKKTSDNIIVKDNLTKLKETLILLNSTIKAQKGEINEISQIPQVSDLKIIETSDDLKIVESNESLAEKVEEKVIEKIEEKIVNKSIIIETPEIPTEQSQKEPLKTEEQKILETKIVEQDRQIPTEPADLQICLEKSKEGVSQIIESIKKVRRTTPEIQAIEKQLSTTFENIMEIASNEKIIEDILCKIEAAETSITTRKTTDIVLLKENFSSLKQSLVMLKSVIVQQNVHVKSIDKQPQHAEIGVIETQPKNELKVEESKEEIIINEKVNDEGLKITEDITKSEEQKSAEETKVIESEKVEHKKSEEVKIEAITKIEESKPEKELISTSETATQKILPEIQESLGKTKENIETVTILIKKARRPTDELQAAEKELTIILENISQLPQNQQQIEKVIEKIETAEASLVARKTSDIALVKENLTSLKQSLVTLNNTIKTHNTLLSTVMETPQIGNLQIIEVSEELKIVESNESLDASVDEKINKISKDVEIINETAKEIEKSEDKTKGPEKPKEPEVLNEPVVEISAESKPQEDNQKINEQIIAQKQEPMVETSEDVNVDFCIKQSKTEIENTMATIKSVRRPTPELQATEKDLVLTLQKFSDLPNNEILIEKAISSIESAEASLVAKKTSDIVLVKQNLSVLKESFVKLKNTIKDVSTVKQSAELQIIEPSEDLKIVESNENISAAVQPVEKIIEKSKVDIENTVESIKKVQKPTAELQATEKELETALEHLSDLQHDEKIIEKVIESIAAAETSLTAKKTSDVALIKENLSQLKESLTTLKTNVEELKVNVTETPITEAKILDLPVVEPSNDLKIIESNEDLTVTNETPKIEELEGLQITESEQLTEVTLSLAKSRDEIENVMFAIRKARHPPSEVCAVEKILTFTYEQLFELPKDEKFIDKAIESIELAEISLVPRGAGDLIVIKNNLEVLKQSLIKIISYTNPQKAESLLHEIQKPQVAKVSEIQEQKQVEEEKPQELTSKLTLEKLIEKSVELIKSSRRPTPEVQAIEKKFTLTIENVSNFENDKQEIEKVIELIETAEASLAEKRTSDIVLIKENLAIVKETLNTLKLTAKSKPIEIIELQQQKPDHAIIMDEKLKKEELEKEIVDKKSVEKQQESIELKESEAQLPLQTEIQETQKQQPNETVEKLKTEIVSTIESIKKVRRPNPEIQAVERELTMAIEHVNELPNDEKKIEKVIAIIENTEASLVAKRTSDIAVVKNNLSELKQTLNVMKTVVEPSTHKVSETKILELAQAEQKITSEAVVEKSNENLKIEEIIEKTSVIEKIPTEKPILDEKTKLDTEKPVIDQKSPEGSKDEQLVKATTAELNVEKISLSKDQVNLKSDIESSIQSIKKALRPTSELEDTEKILSIAFENVSDFSGNVIDVQKAIESIIIAEVSLIAKRTSDMVLIKSCLGNLKEKLTVVKNNLKPQKPEIMGKEEPKKASIEDEPKMVEEKPKEEQKKIDKKPKEEPKIVDEKPKDEPKIVDEKPKEEPKKIDEKPTEELKIVDEKPKEEPKIVDEKPKEEPKKIDEKPKEEPKKIEEKPTEELKKIEEKPTEELKKVEEKPKVESKKIEEKLPAELKKVKIEIVDAIDSIKKIRRTTTELNSVENEFKTVLEHIKEIPNNQQGLLKIISSIEAAETSLATRRTSDIMILKEKLNSLKGSLSTFKIVEKIDEAKVESLIEQAETKEEIKSKDVKVDSIIEPKQEKEEETPKIEDSQSKEKVKGTEEDIPKDDIESKKDLKPNETEKPKSETIICEESPKLEEKPKVPESDTIRKLRTAIANVSTTIKKIRRPTPELQTVDSELTIIIKKLPEFENEIEKIDKNITLIVKAEDSIITKKTSDMLAVKESLSKMKNTLTEIRDSIKPNIEMPKETEKLIEEEKSKDIEQVQESVTMDVKVEEKVETKMEDVAKSMEVNLPVDETKPRDEIKSTGNLKSSVNDQPKEVQKPDEQLKVEEKPKVPESATVRRLRTEIENVSATIKKVRRPTPELQTAENELTIVIKKLPEFENDVGEIDNMIKVINRTEDSIITKKTSDMIAVKEKLLSLKNVLTELSELKKPKIEKPNEIEKPKDEEKLKTVEQIQEKTEEKIEPEISTQSQKLDEKPSDVKITEEPTQSKEEPLALEIEKFKAKEQIPEIRLNEISLKIKSEIENIIHSIKKSRRPTSELQSFEKSLNIILDLKIIAELPTNLKRIEETLKSIDVTESSLTSKKTSDMILVKNNINLLKEVLVSCKNKLAQPQEIKAVIKPADITEEPTVKEETLEKEIEPEKLKIPELPKEFEQPSEVLLDIHEKDLMFQYIIGIKQDIEEVLVMIKKARRPSTELQTLHESLMDLKPKVDNLTKDSAYFDAVLHIVTKAKSALLTKRTMDMILLREKVTSLESSLTLLKSTIVTEINGQIIAAKQEKVTEKTKMEEKVSEKMEIDSSEQKVRASEEKKEIIEEVKTEIKQAQLTKYEEISREPIKHEELEPQKPVRRRKQEEPAKIEEDKIETMPEPIRKEESKPQIIVEPELAPVPTERRRQQQTQDNSVEIKKETEPVKPSRRRRAEELKEEEKSLPRTPETRRKRMPTFIARLKNRSAPENSILKLTCAVSEPEVTARWTKQGMILKDSEKYSIENSNGVLSIEIKNACAQDAGEYYCFVSNSCGEIETSAFITIFGEDVQPSNATFTKNLKGEFMAHYFKFFAIVGFM